MTDPSGETAAGTRNSGGPLAKKQLIALGFVAVIVAAALVLAGYLEKWNFGESIGIAGLTVSIGGFGIALYEIRRTRQVTTATAAAVDQTLKGVAASRLLIAITELRLLVDDLEDAAEKRDAGAVRRDLTRWSYVGADAQGLLQRRFPDGHPALEPLGRSISMAGTTKSKLYEGEVQAWMQVLGDCLTAMNKTAQVLGPLVEELHLGWRQDGS